LKASTIQFGVTNILTNLAPLNSRDVKLRYEECLLNWWNANKQRIEEFTANTLKHIVNGIYKRAGINDAKSHSGRAVSEQDM